MYAPMRVTALLGREVGWVGGRSRGFDMFFSGSDQIPTLTYKKKENTLDMSRIRKNEL